MTRVALIMAGGSGERFWPVSRLRRPKQLLALTHPSDSLLKEAIDRAAPLFGYENVWVATAQSVCEPVVASGVAPVERILVEPAKRNTLGCLVWAAAELKVRLGTEFSMAVLTADHRIGEPSRFRACVARALAVAETEDALVTLGIPPTRPETGFGYIEVDGASGPSSAADVRAFREKPDLAQAQAFLKAGNAWWNSGMYFWTLPAFERELRQAQPEAFAVYERIFDRLSASDRTTAAQIFEELPNISIDFALTEKAKRVKVVPADFPWDDVGSWDALERSFPADESGNVAIGEVFEVDANGCLVYNDSAKSVAALVGVENLLIVVTDDAVLVCPKSDAQRVREIVVRLKTERPDKL